MANVFKLVAHFYWGGLGGRSWRSSFELAWDAAGIDDPATNEDDLTPSEFLFNQAVADDFADFLLSIHLTPVYLDRITVSTWLPDTRNTPGDPETYGATEIKVFPIGRNGLRPVPPVSFPLDLETTLFIRREVRSGRLGRLNLRGVLHADDIETNAQGKTILRSTSTVGPAGANWATAIAYLTEYLNPVDDGALRLVMFGTVLGSGNDGNLRDVIDLLPAGVTTVNLTKRNRAPNEQQLLAKLLKLQAKSA